MYRRLLSAELRSALLDRPVNYFPSEVVGRPSKSPDHFRHSCAFHRLTDFKASLGDDPVSGRLYERSIKPDHGSRCSMSVFDLKRAKVPIELEVGEQVGIIDAYRA